MNDVELSLAAYADGELDAKAAADVEALLATDARARRIVQMHREATALLRTACAEEFYTGAQVRQPIRKPINRLRFAYGMAASIALMIGGFGLGWSTANRSMQVSFIDDVAEYHEVYARETTHLVELTAAQGDEINRWLGGHLQRNVVAPDLRNNGLRFAGARMWITDGKPVADLLYTRDDGPPVALCIVHAAERDNAGKAIATAVRGDLTVASWQDGGYTFAVVGEMETSRLNKIADEARRLSAGPLSL